jgi:methyl-accepting chemotaxis protein
LARSFKDALPDVLEMGMEASDLSQMYKQIAETSGRITPVSADDAEKIMGIAAATNMMASESGGMAEAFSLMGLSVDSMEENLMETFKSSQSMGLNATKVIKTLQSKP